MNDKQSTNPACSQHCGMHLGGAASGFIIIVAGVLWLLSRMGILDIPSIYVMWPSILIAFGFIKLFHKPLALPRVIFSVLLMSVGAVLQLNKLGLAAVNIHIIWPFLIIIVGVLVIWMSAHHKRNYKSAVSENHINKFIVFGGEETHFNTKQFQGGIVTAVFGGAVIDLRQTEMADSPTTFNISAVFGGVEIRVPTHWRVVVQGAPVLGGFENKTRIRDGLADDEIKTLIIQGNAVFGGVEIKN